MFVVIVRKPKLVQIVLLTLLLLLVGALALWSWLQKPNPPPVIGLQGLFADLVYRLFAPEEIGQVWLGTKQELEEQLGLGNLDYILEIDAATPGLPSRYIGDLEPIIIVPFFASLEEMDEVRLESLLATDPSGVFISNTLALPHFPWWDRPVSYGSSAEVIHQVREGAARIGVIPREDRVPSVRELPLGGTLSLHRSLFLMPGKKSPIQKWKARFTGQQELQSHYQTTKETVVTLAAVGDIMLNRDVKKVGLQKGWEHIFAEVMPYLSQVDLAFANLESPIGDKGHFINMFQAPTEAILGLTYAGFDLVSLANNHTLDYHHEGMFETMRLLTEHQIAWVGAGQDIQQARTPLIREVNGVKLGFLAYTEMWFVHAREPISWQATDDEPGVAPAELDMICEDIRTLRELVDCLIVSIHWGKEYDSEANKEQKNLARAAVDAGADIILGHHPHVLQGIEFYKQGVIAYSLGNFVFDLNLPKTWETMILEFTLSPSGPLDLTILPAYIFGVQPRILQDPHRYSLYEQIRHLSLALD